MRRGATPVSKPSGPVLENSALGERTARGLRPRAVTCAQICRLGRLAYL